jgi:hypothetical protein
MKKILFFGALVALLLGTAACSSDMEPSMGDNMVRFTIEMPGNIDSRAISDGLTANKLTVAVYDEDGHELSDIRVNKDISHQTTVEFKLVKGQKYSFAFWAQAEGAPYTFDTANKTVNVSYEGAKSNDEKRDAFYAYRADLTVTGPMSETIYLYRPFCQLNYGASDYADAIKAGVNATKSAVTVNHAATSFNLATGTTEGDVEISFTKEILPNNPATLTVEEKAYQWMAMNYFLVPNNQATIETSLQLYEGDATEAVRDITVPNVPVQKNHRTNIVGNLFTEDVNFLVIIDERFDQPDYNVDINGRPYLAAGTIQVGVNGEQYTTLAEAIAAADGETVYLGAGTYDEAITVADGQTVSIASAGDLTAADVIIPKQIKAENGATLNINGVTVKTSGTNDSANNAAIYVISSTATIQNVATEGQRGINVEGGSTVTIEGCDLNANIGTYQRGINVIGENNDINVKNSTVKAGWYAFNFVSSASNNTVVLDNANVIGWACFNFWANGNNISATNCEFTSINDKDVHASNTFAAVKFENSASNNVLTIDKSNVLVESKNANKQYLILFGGNDNTVNCTSVNVTGRNTNTEGYVIATIQGCGNYNLNLDDACTIDWE